MTIRLKHYFEFGERGEFRLEPEKLRLWRGDSIIHIRPKTLEILRLLIENRSRIVHREEILETVWKDTYVEEGNINFNISLLRKAIASEHWQNGGPIKTIPKEGYRFVADVREVVEENAGGETIEMEVLSANSLESAVIKLKESPLAARSRTRWHFVGIALLATMLVTSFALWQSMDGGASSTTPLAGRNVRSIAVLPLRQIGDDPSIRLLGLGITDQLINKVGSSGSFIVRPFSAVEKFDQSGSEPVEFGQQLKVDAVIEGTLQLSGDRLRMSVRLFDVRDGSMVWSESFEESASDVFVVQDRLADNVARSLQISLSGNRMAKYAINREAYESYLRGRYFFDKRDKEGFKKARAEFEKAIAIDPNFALAYSGLADVYMLQLEHDSTRIESMRNARIYASKALELDEGLAEAQTSLAWIYRLQDWNWEASERHFKRAIEINPNYLNARQWYALLLTTLGRLDEAIVQIEKAKEIDPLSWVVFNNYTTIAVHLRDPGLIRSLALQRAELAEKENIRLRDLAIAFERAGDIDEGFSFAEQLRQLKNGKTGSKSVDARLGIHYQRVGRTEDSRQMLERLEKKLPADTFAAYHLAMAYADLGRPNDAIRMIELCFKANDPRLLWIKVEPRFDPLRSDPRFQTILEHMRLL